MSEYQGLIDDFVSKAEKAMAEGLKQYPQTTVYKRLVFSENEDGEMEMTSEDGEMVPKMVEETTVQTKMVDIDIDPEDEEKLLESNHAQIQNIVEILQGLLEDEDAVEELKAAFEELDKDGSGELSMEEARPFCVEMIKEQCEEYGADEPPEEVLASMVEDSFKSMDVDSDGMLTEAEFVFGLALQKATIEAPMADPMYCLCIDDDGHWSDDGHWAEESGHATVFDVRDPPDGATVAGAPAEAVDDSNDAEAAAIAAKTEAVKVSTTRPASAAAKPAAKPAAAKPAAKPAAEKPAAEKPAAKPAAKSGDRPAAKKSAAKTGKKKKKSGCCQQ